MTHPPPHLQLLDRLFPGIGSSDSGPMHCQKSPPPWTGPHDPSLSSVSLPRPQLALWGRRAEVKMRGLCLPSCHALPPRRGCCVGAAPDPHYTAGLRAGDREGESARVTSRKWMLSGPTTHIVPPESDQAPWGPFLGVGLCSSVHNLGSPQANSEAPRRAPTREMTDLVREDPLPGGPSASFCWCGPRWPTTCSWRTETSPWSQHAGRDPRASI